MRPQVFPHVFNIRTEYKYGIGTGEDWPAGGVPLLSSVPSGVEAGEEVGAPLKPWIGTAAKGSALIVLS